MSDQDKESTGIIGHDSPIDQKCRVYASISFAVLLLGIGLPLWWETTAVPRVPLPFRAIRALDELELEMMLKLNLGCLDRDECGDRAVELLSLLTNQGQTDIYKIQVSHFSTIETSIAKAKSIADLDKLSLGFNLIHGSILILEAPFDLGENPIYVSSNRSIYFSQQASMEKLAEVMREWIYRDDALVLTRDALAKPTEFSLDVENRRRFPASPSYDVLLTLVNPEPEELKVDRETSDIAQDYIEPFLNELSLVANFSVKTQWLYLLPLGVKPKYISNKKHFALTEDLLPQIITPLETKLASQVSLNPTINLVAYVVPCSSSPLYIYKSNGYRLNKEHEFQAFLSPRWGGIVFINPPEEFCTRSKDEVFKPDERLISGVFLAHLRLLLGIPDKKDFSGVTLASFNGVKPRNWEVDSLLRIKTVEQLTSAKLTLQSLARLLREISNIVITETVGGRIKEALEHVQLAFKMLVEGQLQEGFLASKQAFVMAEAAFTDPSLLALLYFPDDQKYAVYIPLFLPVLIPVVFSLKNIKNYLFCSD